VLRGSAALAPAGDLHVVASVIVDRSGRGCIAIGAVI
jgi:hypothetical protein